MTYTPQQVHAAKILLERRRVRSDLNKWAGHCGFTPAHHHRVINRELEAVEKGENKNLIICTPPGSAKSTYTSKLFPPVYIGRKAGRSILACSYSKDLVVGFGRWCRNTIEQQHSVLGYKLNSDSRAADDWETTNGGHYFCAGVGAGIAGHRADLGLIDDPIGSEEEAQSKLQRDKVYDWYINDFLPRLKPNASRVIIANRRHEDDLVGRILAREPGKWRVIKFPRVAVEDNDILGRMKGDRLWPEWFTQEQTDEAMSNPRASGIEQQEPSPEDGDFFHADWLREYSMEDLEKVEDELNIYASSDHTVSKKQDADLTCIGAFGVDSRKNIYILPDVIWKRMDTKEAVDAMMALGRRRRPLAWAAEGAHIEKAIGPFLREQMNAEQVYFQINELSSSKDKMTKAQSIQGRMATGKVFFPKFASWYPTARREILMFPNGKNDDFVDFIANIGRLLDKIVKPSAPAVAAPTVPILSARWLKAGMRRREGQVALRKRGF